MASIPLKACEAIELTRHDEADQTLVECDRIDELETLMAMADVIGVPPAETALPRARFLSRRGAFEPALPARNDGQRATPIGDYESMFAAFTAANRRVETARMRERHGDLIASLVRTTTPRWYDNWTAAAFSPKRPPPVF